jgi:2-methylisocitrate lyase-like PEP mutase family enzyme
MSELNLNTFTELHSSTAPLVLTNIWDAASALLAQANGQKALATSSAAIAWANGYPDGDALPMDTLLHAMKNIMRVAKLPVSVDIESGYSQCPEKVAQLAGELAKLGVVGINIEDGAQAPEKLIEKIAAIRATALGKTLFINARTDVYLRGLAMNEMAMEMTASRLISYQAAGANCGFIPGNCSELLAKYLAKRVHMPLNFMMTHADAALIKTLHSAGISRFTTGPLSFLNAYSTLTTMNSPNNAVQAVTTKDRLDFDTMNKMMIESCSQP